MFFITSYTIQIFAKKLLVMLSFLINFLISLKLMQASQALIPWEMLQVYFITQQSAFVVPVLRSRVPGVLMAGTLEIIYWQMRAQLVSGPIGTMGCLVTRKQ